MSEKQGVDPCSRDAFLGGKLMISQPLSGYRAGIDPVLLAASIDAQSGDRVLELGCGVGAAALCLARRVQGLHVTGVELQPDYATLARENASRNDINLEVIDGDLSQMPATLRQRDFDHVIANPPYFDRAAGTQAYEAGREIALGEQTPLRDWLKVAAKRAGPKGRVTFIYRADRLPELLSHAEEFLGSLEVLPLIPRVGKEARLILLRGRKGGRANFRLHDGWVLHEGSHHDGDRESYTKATASVLREGAALPFSENN